MTNDEAVTRIKTYLGNRSDISPALVSQMLNERIKMLAVPFKFPEHEATGLITTTADTDTIALPTGVYAIEHIVDVDNDAELQPLDFSDYRAQSSYSTGLPVGFSFYGSNIYLSPTPIGAYSLRWYGFSLPADISGATEIPFPEDWHPLLVKYVASDILFLKGNHERALTLKNEALGDLSTRVEPRTFQRRNQVAQISVGRPRVSSRR